MNVWFVGVAIYFGLMSVDAGHHGNDWAVMGCAVFSALCGMAAIWSTS